MTEYRFLLWPGVWSVIAMTAALGWVRTALKHSSLRVKWHDLHTKHATAYRKALCDGVILIDDTYKRGDPKQRSLAMGSLVDSAERISEVGAFIDRMTHSGGALSAVGRELRWFTRSIWDAHFDLPLERDRADGPALSNTELCVLRSIYEIMRSISSILRRQ